MSYQDQEGRFLCGSSNTDYLQTADFPSKMKSQFCQVFTSFLEKWEIQIVSQSPQHSNLGSHSKYFFFVLNHEPNKTCLQTQLCSRIVIVFSRQDSKKPSGWQSTGTGFWSAWKITFRVQPHTEASLGRPVSKIALTWPKHLKLHVCGSHECNPREINTSNMVVALCVQGNPLEHRRKPLNLQFSFQF